MDISPDAMFLTTLSSVEGIRFVIVVLCQSFPSCNHHNLTGDEAQSISLWEWTVEREEALYTSEVAASDIQRCVRFNTNDIREIVSSGRQRVIFWNWEQRKVSFNRPTLS